MKKLTSFSPTRIIKLLPPFGKTCAKSPNLSLCFESFTKCTLKFSKTSGLNLPPVLSFDKSTFNFSRTFSMEVSREEKSWGSSVSVALEEVFSAAIRSALVIFLREGGVLEKLRIEGGNEGVVRG